MELKLDPPLTPSAPTLTFNRTTMELKLLYADGSKRTGHPFNRTTMELKPRKITALAFVDASFNRTTMELKLNLLSNNLRGQNHF